MRSFLLFLAGFVAAMGLTRATVAIACCFQPSEYATMHLVSTTIDGEPTTHPDEPSLRQYEISALWDGLQISMLDGDGYVVGGESYQRRQP